jgi:NTP pyrophosphatase (non-canonical NTP hydrolase)
MHLNDYQTQAMSTAEYPSRGYNIVYPALGLAGETGEVVEIVKKAYRLSGSLDGVEQAPDASITRYSHEGLILELGDILWYVAALAAEIGCDLSTVARLNLEKLAARQAAGTIKSREAV